MNRNILIADDNIQILDVLKEYAIREGYDVYTAQNGQQALDNATKFSEKGQKRFFF